MKQVSVIIPTYNRESLLPRAIESVLNQHDFDGELIIIDDGSTDSTKGVVSQYRGQNVRYCFINNSGPANARNTGVALSQYSYIAFLDSDDHWHKKKLVTQFEAMISNPQFRISHTYENWLRRGQHLNQKKIHIPRHGDIFNHCIQLCAVGMSTVLMEKSLFEESGGFNVALPCCEDYDLWLRISMKWPFLLVPEGLTVKEGGRCDQVSYIYQTGMDKYRITSLTQLIDSGKLTQQQKKMAISILKKKCLVYGNGCIKHGRQEEGRKYLENLDKY